MSLLSGCQQQSGGLQIGDPLPSVVLYDLQGKPVKLPDDFKGKVVLIRFWSIDCYFCDKEVLLGLEALRQKYRQDSFMPIAVNESRIEANDQRLKRFEQLKYPMLVDEYGLNAKQLGVIGLPTTFVLDNKGILREKITGEAGIDEYEKRLIAVFNKI